MRRVALQQLPLKADGDELPWLVSASRLHPERPPVERAYIGTAACIIRMWQASCWERLSFGESCYRAFQEAGEPYTLNSIAGFPLCLHVLFLWGSGQLWTGRLAAAAEDAYSAAEANVDPAHLGLMAVLREFAEASWEPVCSRRVAAVRRIRAQGAEMKKTGECKLPGRLLLVYRADSPSTLHPYISLRRILFALSLPMLVHADGFTGGLPGQAVGVFKASSKHCPTPSQQAC